MNRYKFLCNKVITVRIPEYLLNALKRKYPDMPLSSAIRECIYQVCSKK